MWRYCKLRRRGLQSEQNQADLRVMHGIFAPEVVTLLILGIALLGVLSCLRATALTLARRIAIHNLRAEALRRHSAAMARISEIRAQKIMNV